MVLDQLTDNTEASVYIYIYISACMHACMGRRISALWIGHPASSLDPGDAEIVQVLPQVGITEVLAEARLLFFYLGAALPGWLRRRKEGYCAGEQLR